MSAKKRGLGRGLDALLGNAAQEVAPVADVLREPENDLRDIPVDLIQRGRYQPRRDMDPEALEELAASIRVQGVMQPIVLRPIGADK